MRDAHGEILALGAAVLAVSAEPLAVARAEAAAARLPFAVLSDPDLTVIDRYGLRHEDKAEGKTIARPTTLVLDRGGVVRYAHIGQHPRDRPTLSALLLGLESLA